MVIQVIQVIQAVICYRIHASTMGRTAVQLYELRLKLHSSYYY
jgi:hypothetical protein